MMKEDIANAHTTALSIFRDQTVALSIAKIEQTYREHLINGGPPDEETARSMLSADKDPFWFDAWQLARRPTG